MEIPPNLLLYRIVLAILCFCLFFNLKLRIDLSVSVKKLCFGVCLFGGFW